MNLDELIRTSVRQVAERGPVSSPDVEALRRRGRRTRLLHTLSATVAVAAVVAVGAVVASDVASRRVAAPATTVTTAMSTAETAAPIADAEGAVWRRGDVIHVGRRIVSSGQHITSGPSLLRTGVVYTDTDGTVSAQTPGGQPRELGGGATLGAVGDPLGSAVAWFDQSGTLPELVVVDATTGQELAREDLGSGAVEPAGYRGDQWTPIVAVTGGAVYYRGGDDALMRFRWAQDDYPAVYASKRATIDVANGVTARTNVTVYFTRPSGELVRADGPLKPSGSLSADGRLFLGYDDDGAVVVDTETGRVTRVDVGPNRRAFEGSWSYGSTLMLTSYPSPPRRGDIVVDPPPGWLMACDVQRQHCRDVESFAGPGFEWSHPYSPIT